MGCLIAFTGQLQYGRTGFASTSGAAIPYQNGHSAEHRREQDDDRTMFVPQFKISIVSAIVLCIGALAAADAWGKPRSIPLPVRNPNYENAAPPDAAGKIQAPSGTSAKLPELLEFKLSDGDKEALKATVRAVYKRRRAQSG